MKHIIRSTTGAIVAGMFVAGCSTSPPASEAAAAQAAISNAGQAVDHAATDPHVARYAPGELERANDSLRKATTAWHDKHDLAATRHLAYLAQQRAATAQELANQRAAEESLTVAAAERDQAVSVAAAQRASKPSASTEQGQQSLAGFATGTAKIPTNAMPKIDELATTLKNNPGQVVMIEGHADNVGSPDYNDALAMKRAQAVRKALVNRGIEPSRIALRSYGEQNPLANNDTGLGRWENRSAQVIVGDTEARMVGSSQGTGAATSSGQGEQGAQSGQKKQDGQ